MYTIPPQGAGEVFHNAVDLFNREIVHGILFQTRATTEAQHGSKADSQTGQDIFGLLVDAGRQMLGATLREDAFRHLIALNFGQDVADEFTPLVTFGTKEEDKVGPVGRRGEHGLPTRPEPAGRGRLDAGPADPRCGGGRGPGEGEGPGDDGVEGAAAGAGWPGPPEKGKPVPPPAVDEKEDRS